MKKNSSTFSVEPARTFRGSPHYKTQEVNEFVARDILIDNNHLQTRAKNMTNDLKKATVIVDEATTTFDRALTQMIDAERKVADSTKKAAGSVRKSANELGDTVKRLIQTADVDRLERYVALLERAAAAMSTLNQLEKDGKLDRIISAIR